MRKSFLIILLFALLLASCSQQRQDDFLEQDESEGGTPERSIIPSYSLEEGQYKIVLPYRPSAARGAITNQITNRVDIDEFEEGLRRHSTTVFDPEKLVFEEGQYLTTQFIYDLIDSLNPTVEKKGSKEEDIEAHRNNPRVFSHILEQNYLRRTDDNKLDLEGISIGIALKSVYRFQVEIGGPYYYETIPTSEALEEGRRIAEEVLKEIRQIEGLGDVPIMFALFQEAEQSSPVPGNFMAKTVVESSSNKLGDWETIDEEYVLFPSDDAREKYSDDYQQVKTFSDKIEEFFPNYVGIAGRGFYIDKNLTRLTLDIPIEFYGKGEVIGFTQYTYGLVKEIFPNYYDIEINITSFDGAESLIFRPAGEDEPTVYIYD